MNEQLAYFRYIEVLGDGPALAATNTALVTASSLVSAAGNNASGFSLLYKVSFDLYELCSNYGLEKCDSPAPTTPEAGYAPPYPGMVEDAGIWYFKDRVEYETDGSYYKIRMTFAHDSRADVRSKVIMMSVDETEFIEYDEIRRSVVTDDGDADQNTEIKLSMMSVNFLSLSFSLSHPSFVIWRLGSG